MTCIPVGPLTVAVPVDLQDTLAGPAPWPVVLTVPRVWIGHRRGALVVHFGPVEADPSAG